MDVGPTEQKDLSFFGVEGQKSRNVKSYKLNETTPFHQKTTPSQTRTKILDLKAKDDQIKRKYFKWPTESLNKK